MQKIKIIENKSFNNTFEMGYKQPAPQFPQNTYYNQPPPSSHPAYGGQGNTIYSSFNMEKQYTPYGETRQGSQGGEGCCCCCQII